jgi:hypothetical protein
MKIINTKTFLSLFFPNYNNYIIRYWFSGMIFFNYLTDFSYFPLKKYPKVAEHGQNRLKWTFLNGV